MKKGWNQQIFDHFSCKKSLSEGNVNMAFGIFCQKNHRKRARFKKSSYICRLATEIINQTLILWILTEEERARISRIAEE